MRQILNRNNVQRINLGRMILRIQHHDDIFADGDEVRVRYIKVPSVGCRDDKRLEAILKPLPNVFQVHTAFSHAGDGLTRRNRPVGRSSIINRKS